MNDTLRPPKNACFGRDLDLWCQNEQGMFRLYSSYDYDRMQHESWKCFLANGFSTSLSRKTLGGALDSSSIPSICQLADQRIYRVSAIRAMKKKQILPVDPPSFVLCRNSIARLSPCSFPRPKLLPRTPKRVLDSDLNARTASHTWPWSIFLKPATFAEKARPTQTQGGFNWTTSHCSIVRRSESPTRLARQHLKTVDFYPISYRFLQRSKAVASECFSPFEGCYCVGGLRPWLGFRLNYSNPPEICPPLRNEAQVRQALQSLFRFFFGPTLFS